MRAEITVLLDGLLFDIQGQGKLFKNRLGIWTVYCRNCHTVAQISKTIDPTDVFSDILSVKAEWTQCREHGWWRCRKCSHIFYERGEILWNFNRVLYPRGDQDRLINERMSNA